MANVKVRLKDASENVLHPETDWSVVLNKPSITVDQTSHVRETWKFGGYIDIESGYGLTLKAVGNEIQVADKNTSNATKSLTNYPINWTALNDRPFDEFLNLKNGSSVAKSSIENAVFGTYSIVTPTSGSDLGVITTMFYPAFVIVSQKAQLGSGSVVTEAKRTKGYFLSANGTLEEITDMKNFKGLLDYRKK